MTGSKYWCLKNCLAFWQPKENLIPSEIFSKMERRKVRLTSKRSISWMWGTGKKMKKLRQYLGIWKIFWKRFLIILACCQLHQINYTAPLHWNSIQLVFWSFFNWRQKYYRCGIYQSNNASKNYSSQTRYRLWLQYFFTGINWLV